MSKNLADLTEQVILEGWSKTLGDALIEADNVWSRIPVNSSKAMQGEMGRDWKVNKAFVTGLAGAIRAETAASMEGDNFTDGIRPGGEGDSGEFGPSYRWAQSGAAAFPGIADSVSPGYVKRTVQLKRWRGTMALPMDLFRADRLTTMIGETVGLTMKQTARNIAQARTNQMFASSINSNKYIAKVATVVDAAGCGVTTAKSAFEVTVTDGSIRRFVPGMLVDVRDAVSTYASNIDTAAAVRGIVTKVNPIGVSKAPSVVIATVTGDAWDADPAAGDYICLWGSWTNGTQHGPSGFKEWIKTSAATIFGVNATYYPQILSQTKAVGAALTDAVLRTELGYFMCNHSVDQWPDTLMVDPGVMADFIDETGDFRQFAIQGQPVKYAAGFAEVPPYSYNGKTFSWLVTPTMAQGELWAVKLRDGNITRYTAPALPGAGSAAGLGGDVEFIAPLLGYKGIWMPSQGGTFGTGPIPYIEAPFEMCEEYIAESFPALTLTGCTRFS